MIERLDTTQRTWLADRLPGAELVRDMSWNLVDTTVLHVRSGGRDFVVKAAGPDDTHLPREISAHPAYVEPLAVTAQAARLLDADAAARIILLEYLAGSLVLGTDAERLPDTYRQAGELLRRLHRLEMRKDAGYEERATARALHWLRQPHRVDATTAERTHSILSSAPTPTVQLVPTHGDWHPRNWLADGGTVRAIDFGRFAFRPASTDLARLAAQQWRGHPELEAAFFEGYGPDPRDAELWRLDALREAIGTACWAYKVGDEAFERQGHRMLAEALALF
ncbi:phosphotransferase family protein [Microbacterium sp. NPDC057650]|uniref:phosphotransferase family protein n=1 Tax=unclassified Microbacterium TaxID=2609290 RepID=UPI00366CC4E2